MVLVKVAVQCTSDTFVDNQIAAANRFGSPTLTFVLKIATFPKPENLSSHYQKKIKTLNTKIKK
jgi:hypothetical protein